VSALAKTSLIMQPTLKSEIFIFSELIPHMKKGTPLHRDRQQVISEKFQAKYLRRSLVLVISWTEQLKFSSDFQGNFSISAATHCNYPLHNVSLLYYFIPTYLALRHDKL
jgi:hypothetical protein